MGRLKKPIHSFYFEDYKLTEKHFLPESLEKYASGNKNRII